MSVRLPTHLEVSGLIRAVEAAGGFATVIAKGDRETGIILILTTERGGIARLWERLSRLDESRLFTEVRVQDAENPQDFADYIARRRARDPDGWIIEVDIANSQRFVEEFAR